MKKLLFIIFVLFNIGLKGSENTITIQNKTNDPIEVIDAAFLPKNYFGPSSNDSIFNIPNYEPPKNTIKSLNGTSSRFDNIPYWDTIHMMQVLHDHILDTIDANSTKKLEISKDQKILFGPKSTESVSSLLGKVEAGKTYILSYTKKIHGIFTLKIEIS